MAPDKAADRNYYQLLGVPQDASDEQIREAFREFSRIFHPDSNFFSEIINDEVSPERFAQISQAYKTLKDPDLRRQYDEFLKRQLKDWDEPSVRDEDLWDDGGIMKSRPWATDRFGEKVRSLERRAAALQAAVAQAKEAEAQKVDGARRNLNPLSWFRRLARS